MKGKGTDETKVYCYTDTSHFVISEDSKNTKTILKIKFAHIINVVLQDQGSFVVYCIGQKKYVLRANDLETAQQWIVALLAKGSEEHISINSFDFIKEIGHGSFGKTMLARHIETGNTYAIKIIPKTIQTSYQAIAERNVLILTNSPFIVKLYYAFQTKREFYLVLEYVEGGNLAKYMNTAKYQLTMNQKKQIIAEIALALEHLHKNGIVLRDLKPENILVTNDGHIKLADFGLAKDIKAASTKTLCGTYSYIAPEMILSRDYDYNVDWWSLGVISYQLFFGKLPFEARNEKLLFDVIIEAKPKLPSCNEDVYSFVTSLLQKNPLKRRKDVFSHPLMNGFKREDVEKLNVDCGFRPDAYNEEITSDYDENMYPNFSFVYDESE